MITHTNRKGQVYYLHQKTTKRQAELVLLEETGRPVSKYPDVTRFTRSRTPVYLRDLPASSATRRSRWSATPSVAWLASRMPSWTEARTLWSHAQPVSRRLRRDGEKLAPFGARSWHTSAGVSA